MHDLVIANGTIVDGTGADRFEADIAIDDETIVAIGSDLGPAARTIDATGMIVTPGWVDIHTHYDGQLTWDPDLAPSSINGVTSLVVGNCGVGFAPARPDNRQYLIELLEGVEDIPGAALAEGLQWEWESFPEFLDALDRREWPIDIGTQVPHAALRYYVMGDDGADMDTPATADQIATMAMLCEEAISAGAMGFTTSRTIAHRTSTGRKIGTLKASTEEVLGIAAALGKLDAGVIQLISDAYQSDDDELVQNEIELLRRLATEIGRPISFTVQQNDDTPSRFRELLGAIEEWNDAGADAKAQVAVRPIGVLIGLNASANPLNFSATHVELADLSSTERLARLRDEGVRRQILDEHADARPRSFAKVIHSAYDRMYPLADVPDYEPTPEHSVAGIAAAQGRPANEVMYDLLVANDGEQLLYIPLMNYATGDLDDLREMMTSPHSIFGLSDAGAHCNAISDGSFPTTAITHWTRDRSRGDRIPLEQIVHQQTQATAEHVGWTDRGVLAVGKLADINVIDHDRLQVKAPHLVADLPAGGTRLMQDVVGYRATIKRGVITLLDDELTGERPGRLQRA
jgi:N-acyl-D-aspartate/D-glutamate deacylase